MHFFAQMSILPNSKIPSENGKVLPYLPTTVVVGKDENALIGPILNDDDLLLHLPIYRCEFDVKSYAPRIKN